MSAASNFRHTLTRFEGEKIAPWIGLRNAIGIVLPLVLSIPAGAVPSGVLICTGALNVSFSDGEDAYLRRGRRMLLASVMVAVAVFSGASCGSYHSLATLLATTWAFCAGMLVALGTTPADIGVVSLVTLVVFSGQPMDPHHALLAGLLAFAGGMLQTSLSLALWPVRRYEPERRALGTLYIELSRSASSRVRSSAAPPASVESTNAHVSVSGVGRHSVEGERHISLFRQAERIRLSLLTLSRLHSRMERDNTGGAETDILRRYFVVASRLLQSIGDALALGRLPKDGPESLQQLQLFSDELRKEIPRTGGTFVAAMVEDARFQIDALNGQLRSVLDLLAYVSPAGGEAFDRRQARQPWKLRLEGAMAILRANLSFQSAAFRHAVRLAVCVAFAEALGRSLEWERAYWIPMTVAIVLKPDFTATLSRGVLRLIGTFAGLVLATALFHVLPISHITETVLIAVLMFTLRSFGPANYGILSTAVTAMVVVLFAMAGVSPTEVIAARGLNTAMGGTIALVAYWFWPTWERSQVPEALARLLDSYRDYFRIVRGAYSESEMSVTHALDRARIAGRLARSNLEASVDRLSVEPGTPPERMAALSAILASSHRFIHAAMALEAGLSVSRPAPPREAFTAYSDDVEKTLYYLSSALRGSVISRNDLPDLREDHRRLVEAGDPLTERYALVNVETDRITNSLNTLSEDLLSWAAGTSGSK